MRYQLYGVVLLVLLQHVSSARAADDMITVHNDTSQDLFAKIYYYYKGAPILSVTNIERIPAHSTKKIKRPVRKLYKIVPPAYYDRQLVFSADSSVFKSPLSETAYTKLASTNVGGLTHGSDFTLEKDSQGNLKGHSLVSKVKGVAVQVGTLVVGPAVKAVVKKTNPAIKDNPYKNVVASVRVGNGLSSAETAYLAKHAPLVKVALEAFLQIKLDGKYVPKIALVCSGGGYRAMAGTLGSLVGSENIGLLNATTWLVGLSGSTWAIGLGTTTGLPFEKFRSALVANMQKHPKDITQAQGSALFDTVLVKYAFDQNLTLIDLYGNLLTNRLLTGMVKDPFRVYMSEQVKVLENGSRPFPLYSAVQKRRSTNSLSYRWWEFSPYEVGSAEVGAYVPTWAFGRTFNKGKSTNFAPEQTLGFYLGIFGSAFAADVNKVLDTIKGDVVDSNKKAVADFVFKQMVAAAGADETVKTIGNKRIKFSWGELADFTTGMPQEKLVGEKEIRLSDGGIAFNLPYPLVSGERAERKADVLIFLDYSSGIEKAEALRACEAYAKEKKLKFPVINYTNIAKKAVSVFKDPKDASVPVVVYMPLIQDNTLWQVNKNKPEFAAFAPYVEAFDPVACTENGYCSTFNFVYTLEQAKQLSAYTEFVMMASKGVIVDAIKGVVTAKSK